MYNVNNHVDTKAGNVDLPEVSTNPGYFEYGCGGFMQITESLSASAGLTSQTGSKTDVGLNLCANLKF
jgi:hypothetical protein